jgi:PAS domain S-box-containing protein
MTNKTRNIISTSLKSYLLLLLVVLFFIPFSFISYISIDNINKEISLNQSENVEGNKSQKLNDLELKRLEVYLSLSIIFFIGLSLIIYLKQNEIKNRQRQALDKSNKKFTSIINNIPAIFFNCKNDADCTMNFMSDQITNITGFKASDFIGSKVRSYASIIHPDDQEYVATEIAQQFKKNERYSIDYRIIDSDGNIKWLTEQGEAVRDENDVPIEIDGFIYDFTSKKLQEQNEKLYQARIELSEDIAGIGYWEFDPNTQEVFWSNKIYDIHGVTKDSYTPTIDTALSFYHPDDVELVRSELKRFSLEKTSYNIKARIIKSDGEVRNVYSRGRQTYNEKMQIQKIVGVFQDITENIQQEIELENQIRLRTQELQNALDMAKIAEGAKSDFFANMSHELRTPLNSIIGMAQLLEKTDMTDEQTEMFGYIKNSSSVLLKTVNDILDVSKIEANELHLEKIPFDVFENLRGTVETLRAITKKDYVSLTHNLNNLSQAVIGDPSRFTRIANNLIANAIRYTDEGSVRIEASVEDHATLSNMINFTFSVTDTGIGIEASKIDVIFEKFIQADNSITRRFGGTGLGLAITKELVEMMNGKITVVSEIGVGSTFTVSIPFEKATIQDLIEDDDNNLDMDDNQSTYHRLSIEDARFLIAEDHDMNQLFIRKLLDNLGAKYYKIVGNGELAVLEVQNNNYDVVLMDCHMPVLSGYDATVKIRFLNDTFIASIPIIAMTANAMPEDKALCLQTGMNAYMSKPIDIIEFKKILSQWINFESDLTQKENNEMSPVNLDNLISNSQGDDEFVKEMLILFTEQASEQIAKLGNFCVDGESKEWVEVSHTLKGTAGTVGAESMRLICATAQKASNTTALERKMLLEGFATLLLIYLIQFYLILFFISLFKITLYNL